MLYVLLVLLKIIGILLALVIGLIILILAAPVRYSFRFHMDENMPPGGQVKVTWLFCILYMKASYIDKIFDYRVRIFGYQIMGNQKEFLEKKQKKKEQKQKAKKEKEEKQKQKEKREKEEKQRQEEKGESREPEELRTLSLPEEEKAGEDAVGQPSGEATTAEAEVQEADDGAAEADVRKADASMAEADILKEEAGAAEADILKGDAGAAEAKKTGAGKRKRTSAKAKDKNIRRDGRLASLRKKIEGLKAVWKEYNGKQLLDFAKTTIIKIMKHVLPRKISGYIRFGFDDPAVTGIVTGAAALFYPKYQNSFSLEPDFQRQCFSANCRGRGRIHLGFFVYIGITALLNRDVRNLIKKIL